MLQPPKSSGLNVIALISGGKDSLYSILHCIRNGHKVVALANLHPPPIPAISSNSDNDSIQPETADDIDSFMYQTIGWSVIPLYEEALGIPLYRAPIIGGAVDAGRVYRNTNDAASPTTKLESAGKDEYEEEDETESLIPLLRKVMAAHPEANAVCAGAILSTYQRTRIEDIASRLGLVPLAWLWQYPFLPAPEARRQLGGEEDEAGLLTDMAAVGCSARIVKVASGALDEEFLWGDVSDAGGGLRRRIVKGVKRFGMGGGEDIRGAVLGEGGEYETLAVDGPEFLWRGRIEIGEEGREVRSGEGGVGYLRLKGAKVIRKSEDESDGITPGDVRRPALLDGRFAAALDALYNEGEGEEDRAVVVGGDGGGSWSSDQPIQSVNGGIWMVSNLIAPEAGPGAAEQVAAIVKKIQAILDTSVANAAPRTTADIAFTTVLLRSMTDFPSMNGIYVSLFEKPNPPARATVACGDRLPDGVNVMVSMVVDLGPRVQRDGLHVQSRSYWAPANIGPYSQAISVPLQGTERVIYIAGQIPLEPASMDLVEVESPSTVGGPVWAEMFCLRAVLSLQHMWRIGATMEVGWWLGTVAYFTGQHHIKTRARLAWELWQKMHEATATESEEEEDEGSTLDVWDIKYGRRGHEYSKTTLRPSLPNFELVETSDLKSQVPAFFAVQVHELPRNSDIEWQGLGYRCEGVKLTRSETEFGRTADATTSEGLEYSCIEIDCASAEDLEIKIQRVMEVYTPSQPDTVHCVIYSSQPLPQDCCQGQIVPCKSVWGAGGKEVAAGVVIQRQA